MKYNLDKWFIVDIEAKGLLPDLKSSDDLHCVSVGWEQDGQFRVKSTNKEEDIAKVFENPDNTIVGHFFLAYDLPALRIMFPNINFRAKIIDSLAISHYLYNDRLKHGLEDYGVEFGFEKVKIESDEWENLSYEKAVERCERDCLINYYVWKKELALLRELYINDDEIHSPISRANFKMILLHIQENNKIKLDVELCKKNLAYLEGIISEKVEELKTIMPKIPIKATRTKPKNLYKKTGELSEASKKWFYLVKGCNLPEDYDGEIIEIIGYNEPNPSSSQQMKDFLISKGRKAKLFKDGANGKVPQLRDDNKELCSSIKELIKTVPELEALDGLSVAQHRAGYLKAFLDTMTEDGYVTASWSSMAKTWRVKHSKPIVNLPSNNSKYGELVRSCLIAPEGKVFVNADLSSLEDKTKQCCIYPYDPSYVETLNTPGYDAHLRIAELGNFMSEDEIKFFKWYKKENRSVEELPETFKVYTEEDLSKQYKRLSNVRKSCKVTNYSATYGASPKKIAESADISEKEAKALHKTYWDLNWSVKKFSEDLKVKTVDGRNWIYNPFTKLWIILSSEHIRFSSCNQNFGACVFDTFLWFLVQAGVKPIMSIHDELSFYIDEGQEDWARKIIKESMDKVNKFFNQPIKFESEPEFAKSYGGVH
jgi:hypothetical protein